MSITNLNQNDKFRSWLNKINEIIEALNKTVNDLLGKAPTMHSSSDATYGVGDATNYGHIILSDSINSTSDATKGVAATPYAVKEAYDKAQTALSLAESNDSANGSNGEILGQLQTELANKAPTKHSSSQTIYGLGSNTDYGHVKLTTNLNSEDDTTSGIAVAPLAVKTINDKVTSLTEEVAKKANTSHSSESNTYGIGDGTKYGHVKLSDDVTLNLKATDGVAATIGSVKVAYDLADKADTNSIFAIEEIKTKSPINHASQDVTYGIGDTSKYGHVKVTDSVDLESYAINGIVPSAGALRETYLKANQAYNIATELQNSGVGSGGGSSTVTRMLGENEDLNTVIANGVYISNKASNTLNYPYTEEDCISALEVSKVSVSSGYVIVKQKLYSDNALYVRNSLDDGASWDNWILVAKSKTNESLEIYVSKDLGNDSNDGMTATTPINSIDRLMELINIQSIIASNRINVQSVVVRFDAGIYDTINIFADIPVNIQLTSINESIIPYFPELRVVNSRVTLSGLKIDKLFAQENSTVIIESNAYMSLGHIASNTGSIIYISSLYFNEDDECLPLYIHNTSPEDAIFFASEFGCIYDTRDREIIFEEAIEKSYIFDCSFYGEIHLSSIIFATPTNEFKATQYSVEKYGSLEHPATMIGDPTNNVIEANTRLQGVLWGGGSTAQYLRADGTWQTPPDTTYTLPTATASRLGGVKVGSNISVSSGTISLSKDNVTNALGYTPPQKDTTYSAGNGISISGNTISTSGFSLSEDNIKMLSLSGNTATLPAGGRWFYFIFDGGDSAHGSAGFADGGTVITTGDEDALHLGFAFRVG